MSLGEAARLIWPAGPALSWASLLAWAMRAAAKAGLAMACRRMATTASWFGGTGLARCLCVPKWQQDCNSWLNTRNHFIIHDYHVKITITMLLLSYMTQFFSSVFDLIEISLNINVIFVINYQIT